MKVKKIIVAVLVLGIIGAFVAYKMYNKPHVNVEKSNADVIISANVLLQDFSTDETTANAKYLEKIIQVSGTISHLKKEDKKGIVTLKTNDDFGSVSCHFSVEETPTINTLKTGQNITIKGICTGYLMDVILVKCIILN